MKISPSNLSPQVRQAQETQQKLLNKVATGLKINQAADDAAGLQIANRLTSQSNGLTQAVRNANDGISYAQVADAALSNVTDASFRIEELSIQAANGSLSARDRQAIQGEISQLQTQIGDTIENTQFGGKAVFDGNSTSFQAGTDSNSAISVSTTDPSAFEQIRNIDVSTAAGAQSAIDSISAFREQIDSDRASLGAVQNRFEASINNLENVNENVQAARSRIIDTDYASTLSDLTKVGIQKEAATALQSQANANQGAILNLLGN